MPPKYGNPTVTTSCAGAASSSSESDSFTSLPPRASRFSRFHLPESDRPSLPQRNPIEPFGTTIAPVWSNAAVFHSGLLSWPSASPKSLARR